jgi:hypothetical protein
MIVAGNGRLAAVVLLPGRPGNHAGVLRAAGPGPGNPWVTARPSQHGRLTALRPVPFLRGGSGLRGVPGVAGCTKNSSKPEYSRKTRRTGQARRASGEFCHISGAFGRFRGHGRNAGQIVDNFGEYF